MDFEPLSRTPLYEQVADQIKSAILTGKLAPGQDLPPERELSRSFRVSRASVREALRSLQVQGLVTASESSYRTVVASDFGQPAREALEHLLMLQRVSLQDLVRLRASIEGAALELAATRPERDLEPARTALEEMEDPGVSVQVFDETDVRFHLALVRASGNEAMRLVMHAVRGSIARHLLSALAALEDPIPTLNKLRREHRAIFEAVEQRSPQLAHDLVHKHIEEFYGALFPPTEPAPSAPR
jgi:GntR family transcriptional repressor for pyruvate dehydrogenase complex